MTSRDRNSRESAESTYLGFHVDKDTLRVIEGYRQEICPYLSLGALLQHLSMTAIREHASIMPNRNVDDVLTGFWQQGCDAYPLADES